METSNCCCCCGSQYSTPPWWVTMGFVPPTNNQQTHTQWVPQPVQGTPPSPGQSSGSGQPPAGSQQPPTHQPGGLGGIIGTILNPISTLGSLLGGLF